MFNNRPIFEYEIGSSNRPDSRKVRRHRHTASRVLSYLCGIFSDSTIAWSSSSDTDIASNEIEESDDGKIQRLVEAFFFCEAFFRLTSFHIINQ
jgi:hypothetical protein